MANDDFNFDVEEGAVTPQVDTAGLVEKEQAQSELDAVGRFDQTKTAISDWLFGSDEETPEPTHPNAAPLSPLQLQDTPAVPKSYGGGGGGRVQSFSGNIKSPGFKNIEGEDNQLVMQAQQFNRDFLNNYPEWRPPVLTDHQDWTKTDSTYYEKQKEAAETASKAVDARLNELEQSNADTVRTQLVLKLLDGLGQLAGAHMGIQSEIKTTNYDEFFKQQKAFHKEVATQAIKNLKERKKDRMTALGSNEMDRKEYNKMVRDNAIQTYNAGLKKFENRYKLFTSEVDLRYKLKRDRQSNRLAYDKMDLQAQTSKAGLDAKAAASNARSADTRAGRRASLASRAEDAMKKSKAKRTLFVRDLAVKESKRFDKLLQNAKGDEYDAKAVEELNDEVNAMVMKGWMPKKLGKTLLSDDTSAVKAAALMNVPQWKTIVVQNVPDDNDYHDGTSKSNIIPGVKVRGRLVNQGGRTMEEVYQIDPDTGRPVVIEHREPPRD